MTVSDFLNNIFIRSGVSADDTKLKDILSNGELSKVNLPDDIIARAQGGLFNFEEAKTNGEVKKHFLGSTLSIVDKNIEKMLDQYNVPAEQRTKYADGTGKKNTFENVLLLAKDIADVEGAKAATGMGDKKVLVDKIAELNASIAAKDEATKGAIKQAEDIATLRIEGMAFDNHLKGYQYGNELPSHVNVITSKTLIESALTEKNATRIYKDGKFQLVQKESPELPFTENNLVIDFDTFTKRILDENKMLKVAGDPPAPHTGNVLKPMGNPSLKSQAAQSRRDLSQQE